MAFLSLFVVIPFIRLKLLFSGLSARDSLEACYTFWKKLWFRPIIWA